MARHLGRRVRVAPLGRPALALVGAVSVVVAGQFAGAQGLSADEALRAVEPHTLALLIGMMVIAAGLGEAGFFSWAQGALARRARRPAALLWGVTLGAGLASAFLVNDAVCLLATPPVMALVRARRLPVTPFLFALAMGANAGSALTLAGNPQNMLVAQLSGLAYRDYLAHALLPAGGALVLTAALLHALFRRDLRAPAVDAEPAAPLERSALLVVGLGALVGVAAANLAGASLALSALAGAAVVLVAARGQADGLVRQVDWSIVLFFSALFVLVAALQKTGLPAAWLAAHAPAGGLAPLVGVLSLGSQVVSNVPLILLLEPWIRAQPDPALAWTTTALVSTLAGNLTLLGSVANIIVLERAQEKLGFVAYLRVGLPVTLVTTTFAVLVLRALW